MNIFEGQLRRDTEGNLVFDGESFQCPLPSEKSARLEGWENKDICLGIRPRALSLAGETDPFVFEGQIEVSEMLGEEVLAHAVSGKHKFITSINPHAAAELKNGTIRLTPDLTSR